MLAPEEMRTGDFVQLYAKLVFLVLVPGGGAEVWHKQAAERWTADVHVDAQ